MSYCDEWNYPCEYRIAENKCNNSKNSCYHTCSCQFQNVNIKKEEAFEKKLLEILSESNKKSKDSINLTL